ncbi:hypothetical protein GQ457_07G022410 [Hibiscus cannabinus]
MGLKGDYKALSLSLNFKLCIGSPLNPYAVLDFLHTAAVYLHASTTLFLRLTPKIRRSGRKKIIITLMYMQAGKFYLIHSPPSAPVAAFESIIQLWGQVVDKCYIMCQKYKYMHIVWFLGSDGRIERGLPAFHCLVFEALTGSQFRFRRMGFGTRIRMLYASAVNLIESQMVICFGAARP